MRRCLILLMLMCLLNVAQLALADEIQKEVVAESQPFLTVQLVDETGKPVAGAQTGMVVMVNGNRG